MRRQPQARGGKARYRINAFYELEKRAQPVRDERNVELDVKASYIGSKIFVAHDACKRFGDKVILNGLNYTFARYEKLGIVGDNGVGKSTFIKCLLGREPLDSGYFEVGETVEFGYYSQEGIQFDESKKVIDAVSEIAEYVRFDEKTSYTASQFLQLFLFTPADQQKFIFKLSGGEKRRLYLATVLMRKPNFLILDDTTNDEEKRAEAARQKETAKPRVASQPRPSNPNKMTFKERKEFEALDAEIAQLTAEKEELDALFNSGDVIADIAAKSSRYDEVCRMLDEKEMRWLELSEKV